MSSDDPPRLAGGPGRRRHRVLVFPCGSEIGLELREALAWSKDVELFGATSASSNHGRMVYRRYSEGLPQVDDPAFKDAFVTLLQRSHIDWVYPAHDSVVLELARRQADLPATVLGSPLATCEIARSKRRTYEVLHGIVRVPARYPDGELPNRWPVFLKPDVGQGSRGVHLARNPEEWRYQHEQAVGLLTLEYLPGAEYTVDCFTDRHGTLRVARPRERRRISNGISVDTRAANYPAARTMAEKLNATLAFRGAWFFQVRESAEGEPALLEIAPRVAGSMALFRATGINFPLLTVLDAAGSDVAILEQAWPQVVLDRALISRFGLGLDYDRVYVDLDDTLVLEDSYVNEYLVAFLYQCVNRGVTLHLVTRHAGSVTDTLRRFRLSGLFDTVDVVPAGSSKAQVVRGERAIFIDDSFRERHQVMSDTGIPVFDLDAVPSLLDWRR